MMVSVTGCKETPIEPLGRQRPSRLLSCRRLPDIHPARASMAARCVGRIIRDHSVTGCATTTRSCLQLTLDLIEKAPIGASGNNLLRTRLDHTSLTKPQREEPDRVLRIELPPFGIRNVPERLQSRVIVCGIPIADQKPGHTFRLRDAQIIGLEDSA